MTLQEQETLDAALRSARLARKRANELEALRSDLIATLARRSGELAEDVNALAAERALSDALAEALRAESRAPGGILGASHGTLSRYNAARGDK